ncbi:tetratricopeptide repeat protein [Hyphobacterium sp. HN65]|uniref:Tetratricopeptide repeat protein n=1 Tax=Hyphobacterium lacteum TaxID=3116575 RepID=A0ABU7LNT3_9PROT|nr:tetratricopeptide repeat protein [Hyphobacterium sp. HN65]MEE2525271.1 tetratricopeptide repeat protein [Hyphobacterium sp. HN65]
MIVRLGLLFLSALLLAACQTTSGDPSLPVINAEDEGPSAYGAFLAGRFAGTSRDADGASDYFATAFEQSPDSAILAERTFLSSVLSGDVERAVNAGRVSVAAGDETRLAGLYLAADAMARGRYSEAETYLSSDQLGPFNEFIAELLMDWAQAGQGNAAEALERARAASVPGYAAAYLTVHRALLADFAGETVQADAAYQAAVSESPFTRIAIALYGDFLLRERRREDAIALYDRYLQQQPLERSITEARRIAAETRRIPRRPSVSQMAARAVFGPSAALASQADIDLSVVYLRLTQRLDEAYAPGVVLLAGSLDRTGLVDAAIEAYDSVPSGPFRLPARIDRIWLQARQGELEAALAEARQLYQTNDAVEAQLVYADLLRASGEFGRAAEVYTEALAAREAQGMVPDWRYYYFRAISYEQTNRWALAEADFRSALELSPNEAEVLNYLGYMWVIRGEHIAEAFDMIERAAALSPEQGHILDSLGWAHYVRGNYELAVQYLEEAVEYSPEAPTINYHLGDAYWMVGRHLEARFQWERALTLDPDEDERVGLMARLAGEEPETPATQMADAADAN